MLFATFFLLYSHSPHWNRAAISSYRYNTGISWKNVIIFGLSLSLQIASIYKMKYTFLVVPILIILFYILKSSVKWSAYQYHWATLHLHLTHKHIVLIAARQLLINTLFLEWSTTIGIFRFPNTSSHDSISNKPLSTPFECYLTVWFDEWSWCAIDCADICTFS